MLDRLGREKISPSQLCTGLVELGPLSKGKEDPVHRARSMGVVLMSKGRLVCAEAGWNVACGVKV